MRSGPAVQAAERQQRDDPDVVGQRTISSNMSRTPIVVGCTATSAAVILPSVTSRRIPVTARRASLSRPARLWSCRLPVRTGFLTPTHHGFETAPSAGWTTEHSLPAVDVVVGTPAIVPHPREQGRTAGLLRRRRESIADTTGALSLSARALHGLPPVLPGVVTSRRRCRRPTSP